MLKEEKTLTANQSHNIIMENRRTAHISGVREVLEFDETCAIMQTVMGELEIHGENLHVSELSVGAGELYMDGKITAFFYREKEERIGLMERLFG